VSAATWAGVAVLGGLGAIVRFLVDGRVAAVTGRTFPYGTLAVNVSGALLYGILFGAAVSGSAYVLSGAAVLGSYTTFSTWMYETQRLVEDGRVGPAGLNLVVSLALGAAAALAGRAIGMAL
jgi:CrcB protein